MKAVVAGVEAVMASLGALTTPGTRLPLAILDMGGGSTDAAVLEENGTVRTTHQAGAGELVTMLIQTELGLGSRTTAEQIKKYPMGKVESLFHMRLENGSMQFFEESIDPGYYGHQTWCWLAVPLRTLRFRKCLQKPLQNTGSSADVEISGEQRVRETQWPQVC